MLDSLLSLESSGRALLVRSLLRLRFSLLLQLLSNSIVLAR
jgi:hypothetical protein